MLNLDSLISLKFFSIIFIFHDGRYAREDTHYLLYIYDSMRSQLLSMANPEDSDALLLEV